MRAWALRTQKMALVHHRRRGAATANDISDTAVNRTTTVDAPAFAPAAAVAPAISDAALRVAPAPAVASPSTQRSIREFAKVRSATAPLTARWYVKVRTLSLGTLVAPPASWRS